LAYERITGGRKGRERKTATLTDLKGKNQGCGIPARSEKEKTRVVHREGKGKGGKKMENLRA